jgi:hypothetical protein
MMRTKIKVWSIIGNNYKQLKDFILYFLLEETMTVFFTNNCKAYKKEYNVVTKTAKANYIQHIITSSTNTQSIVEIGK